MTVMEEQKIIKEQGTSEKQKISEEDVFSECHRICNEIKKYLIMDQWLQEKTIFSFISVGRSADFFHFYEMDSQNVMRKFEEKLEGTGRYNDAVCDFLDKKYGDAQYFAYFLRANENDVNNNDDSNSDDSNTDDNNTDDDNNRYYICCSPAIQKNIGRGLLIQTFIHAINCVDAYFMGVCEKKDKSKDHKFVRDIIREAALKTCNDIEQLYAPVDIDIINELSGEYYEKAECKSNLLFLPPIEETEIASSVFQWGFSEQDILFVSDNVRWIRKLMQIAQKDIYLVFQYDKHDNVYKVSGICKESELPCLLGHENNDIPWVIAKMKSHMQWDLFLGKQYIFSFRNGNYKIGAEMDMGYLREKCCKVFEKQGDFDKVIKYVKDSCKQSHGTMLVILKKDDAEIKQNILRRIDMVCGMPI